MQEMQNKLQSLCDAKAFLRTLSSEEKNSVLQKLIQKLDENRNSILTANQKDVSQFQGSPHYQKSLLDRLVLNENRIQQMIQSLRQVIAVIDPVGFTQEQKNLDNGLILKKFRSPLGVIFLIFESRPNVITEAFSLAFKSGNALILKGGKESENTSKVIYQLIEQSLFESQIKNFCFLGLIGASREVTHWMIQQHRLIDVLIPRGGDKLIEYVTENSKIPIIKNDRGLCHVYVHRSADISMALSIIENAKVQRPSVCNSAETLLVDREIAKQYLPLMYQRLSVQKVEFFGCPESFALLKDQPGVHPASLNSFDTEYLDLKLNIKIVSGIDEALEHIEKHSSRHSESIITDDPVTAKIFQTRVDSAAVYWNASTRFTDGGELGLGAEIGISTQKLHVRGPVGMESLTSLRWIIEGQGQVRP